MPLAISASLPTDLLGYHDLLQVLLNVSLTGVILFRPIYTSPDPAAIIDLAYVRLNPAAQRMLQLPERPAESFLTLYPSAANTGIFAFYRNTFLSGQSDRYDVNYQHDGLDNYFCLSAQRSGELLIVSFTDTADQNRTPVEEALRASQAAEKAARAEAEAERQRLRAILMQMPAQVALNRGPEHVYELVNPRYQQLFPARAIQGQPVREALPELAGQQFFELLDRVYQTGEPFYGQEMPASVDYTNSGRMEMRYFDVFFQALRNAEGTIDGLLNFAYDVTEQVLARQQVEQLNQELEARVQERTEEALTAVRRQAEEREVFYEIFEQTPALLVLLRAPAHHIEYVNPAYQGLFPGRQLTGLDLADALPELREQGFVALMDHVYQTGETYFGREMPFVMPPAPDRSSYTGYFNFTYQAYRENGQIAGISIFAYEVTEQVLARQERGIQQRKFYSLFEQAPIGICSQAGPDLVYEFVNSSYQRLVPDRKLLGRPFFEIFSEMAGTNVEVLLRRVYETGETQQQQDLLISVARADGSAELDNRYFTFVYQAQRDDQGRVNGILTFIMEVTAQVHSRRQVQNLNEELAVMNQELAAINEEMQATNEELNESNGQLTRTNVDLDNFIYTASHDLKAPISNIEGLLHALLTELPATGSQTQVIEPILEMMQGAVDRFKQTIDHLTDITKLQHEHTQPREQVNLAAIVEAVRLDLLPLLEETGAQLEVAVAGCPAVAFSAKNLRSVVYNLLSNALKYRHPARAPRVQVVCQPASGALLLRVSDNGLGLDETQQAKLFGMFRRLHTHVEGSGIGLYMVKKMVENVGGKIEVESQVGVGSVFTVYFPS